MNLANFGKELRAIKGREAWVWQGCFIKDMISEEKRVVETGSESRVDGSFQECSNQASLSFKMDIMHSKSTHRGTSVDDKLLRLE